MECLSGWVPGGAKRQRTCSLGRSESLGGYARSMAPPQLFLVGTFSGFWPQAGSGSMLVLEDCGCSTRRVCAPSATNIIAMSQLYGSGMTPPISHRSLYTQSRIPHMEELDQLSITTMRTLAIDAVNAANSRPHLLRTREASLRAATGR
jgi:hypothetical protein